MRDLIELRLVYPHWLFLSMILLPSMVYYHRTSDVFFSVTLQQLYVGSTSRHLYFISLSSSHS